MLFLAEGSPLVTPTSVQIGIWVACAYAAFKIWNEVEEMLERRKQKPEPMALFLQAVDRFADKEKVEALAKSVDDFKKDSSVSRARMYDHIDQLKDDMALRLDSQKDGFNRAMQEQTREVNTQLNDLPNKVLSTLATTYAIHRRDH